MRRQHTHFKASAYAAFWVSLHAILLLYALHLAMPVFDKGKNTLIYPSFLDRAEFFIEQFLWGIPILLLVLVFSVMVFAGHYLSKKIIDKISQYFGFENLLENIKTDFLWAVGGFLA